MEKKIFKITTLHCLFDSLINWANNENLIRAVILVGSRANTI